MAKLVKIRNSLQSNIIYWFKINIKHLNIHLIAVFTLKEERKIIFLQIQFKNTNARYFMLQV
jgi:hypothetical protein